MRPGVQAHALARPSDRDQGLVDIQAVVSGVALDPLEVAGTVDELLERRSALDDVLQVVAPALRVLCRARPDRAPTVDR